jgi:hypothetical protein
MRERGKDVTMRWFNGGHGRSGAAEDERALGLFLSATIRSGRKRPRHDVVA